MKKLLVSVCLLLTLFTSLCHGAVKSATRGTVEYYSTSGRIDKVVIPITFVADGTAAVVAYSLDPTSFTNLHSSTGLKGWYLYKIKTDPGSTGPSNGAWDLDITEATGFVVTRNEYDNLSSTATQETVISIYPVIENTWSVSIGDNAVNDATVVVYLTFVAN